MNTGHLSFQKFDMDSSSTVNELTTDPVPSNSVANLEIIELQPENEDSLFGLGLDDPELSYGTEFFDDIISNESLYSKYLNGQLTFDDLMRELHRKEPSSISQASQGLTDAGSSESNEEDSVESKNSSDPEFVPPRRLQKKRTDRRRRRRGGNGAAATTAATASADSGTAVMDTSSSGSTLRRSRKGSLPVELSHYLGEAERFLNNGQFDEAEEICKNVISQAPQASAPYTVLAELYYRRGNQDKARELLQSAAERCPTDSNLWLSLVEIAEEKKDLALALYYTRQAMRGDKQDASIRQRLIAYLERAGHRRQALHHRLSALSFTPEPTGAEQFRVARDLADEFFKLMDPNGAIRAYETAFEKFPASGTESDKNTVLSMMMQQEKFLDALQFFINYCDVRLMKSNRKLLNPASVTGDSEQVKQYTRCAYPRTLSTELTIKLFLVLVRLRFTSAITPHILKRFTNELAKNHYKWLLDIVKAYQKIGMNPTALQLLTRLSTFESTKNIPVVWTLLAEGQMEAGLLEDALDSYRHVVEVVAPRHAEARLAYGNLLKRVGKDKEALAVLHPSSVLETSSSGLKPRKVRFAAQQAIKVGARARPERLAARRDSPQIASPTHGKLGARDEDDLETETEWEEDVEMEDEEDEDISSSAQARADAEWLESSDAIPDAALLAHDPVAYRLAFERCRMLDRPDTVDNFLDETWTLLFSDVARLCGPNWARFTRFLESMRLRSRLMERLSADSTSNNSDLSASSPAVERNVSGFDIWSLLLRLIDVLQSRLPRSLSFLESATAWACLLPQIHLDEGRRRAASNLLITTCLLGGHGSPAVVKLRELRSQYGTYSQFWNAMNIAITLSRDLRHSRFVDRVFMKESWNYAAALLANNDRIVRGSYRYATGRLIHMRQMKPEDPLVHLLLSVGFLGIALQKHVTSRHPAVLQALGFMSEYRRLRGHCQEVYYNIARLCHQLLLNHVAIKYYEKVLSMEPVGNTELERTYTDLRQEAAFNLALLYRSQRNGPMAHYLIQKYLVI